MKWNELKAIVREALERNRKWIWLLLPGDPNASRQRLLGAKTGPFGFTCGFCRNKNIVRFNAAYVRDYMDDVDDERGHDESELVPEPISDSELCEHAAMGRFELDA